jgi:tetratricopeptide (TPR) repeat protein
MRFAKTRWFLAVLFVCFGVKLMKTGLKIQSLGAAPYIIGSAITAITSVLLITPETVLRVAEWCSRPFVNLLFPSERLSKPPLSYNLARRYRTQTQWDEAIAEYKSIIEHYPDESDAYIELIEVAAKLGDDKLAQKYAASFKKRFGKDLPLAVQS